MTARLDNQEARPLGAAAGAPDATRRPAVPHYRGEALRLTRHSAAPDPSDLGSVRRWVSEAGAPTGIDLFCGAGGLSLGLQDAGFTMLVGADSDPWSVETHTANLGGLGYVGDLTDPTDFLEHLDAWGIKDLDLIAAGVPCQPFSRAGRSLIRSLVESGARSEHDPRAELWESFVTVVDRLRPRAVLVENVPDLPAWDDGAVLIGFYESLRELGYAVDARVLDAYQYGVPQHRARLLLIGLRDASPFEWPEAATTKTTLRDAISDLPPVPPAQRSERLRYRLPRTPFQERMRRDVSEEDRCWTYDHITRDVRPDDAEAFALLEEGQTYEDLPAHLRRYRSDIFTDKYKRLAWDELSRSITAHIAKDGYWYIHPEQNRTLSVREAARVQTFPDRFRFAGEPTHRLRQIGNAVPPLLAQAVGQRLSVLLENAKRHPARHDWSRFRDELLDWRRAQVSSYPWRTSSHHPWLVLMGEMCLQKTRRSQVPELFATLRNLAPTPAAMANGGNGLLATLKSMGLGVRANRIIEVARALIDDFDGSVPSSELELRMLPGVGDYVAQAVLCFGFGRRSVLLESSTARIVDRLYKRGDTRRWQLRLDLYQLAGPQGPDAEFNSALLDFGATVCRANKPRCEVCPVGALCASYGEEPMPAERTVDPVHAQ
jgi:DNA (cytosine-5)-methyltransferase 1